MVSTIFINYRREDSISTAGRLYDRLARAFGQDDVFMDVDHIPAGVDFVAHLDGQIAACDVILVLIGKAWLSARDDSGQRRIDKPDDFVAIEIAAALARNIRVVPILVDGAAMPRASELPDGLKPLARRQAIELRQNQFGRDVDALIERLREVVDSGTRRLSRRRFRRLVAVIGIVVLLAGAAGGYRLFRNAASPAATPVANAGGPSEQVQQKSIDGGSPDQPKRVEAAIPKPASPAMAPPQGSPQPAAVVPEQPRPTPSKGADAGTAKPASSTPAPPQASPQPPAAVAEQSRPTSPKRADAETAKTASPTPSPSQASPQPAPVVPEQPRPTPSKRADADTAKPASPTPTPQASTQAVPGAPEPSPTTAPAAPRGWLGIRIQPVPSELAARLDLTSAEGALVSGLYNVGPAALGGLQPGDIIVKFDGHDVKDPSDLSRIIADAAPGTRAGVSVIRQGKRETHEVTVGRPPEGAASAASQSKAAGTSNPAIAPAATSAATSAGGPSEQVPQKSSGGQSEQPKRAEAEIAKPAPPTSAPPQASPQPAPAAPEQPRPAPPKRAEAETARPAPPPAPPRASPQPTPAAPDQARPTPTKRADAETAKPASPTPVPPQASPQAVPEPRPATSPGGPRGWLGVVIQAVTSDLAASLEVTSLEGALVADVHDQGPAKLSGLQSGDIIVRFDGQNVKDPRDLARIAADTPPGKRVDVVVIRLGKQETHSVTIGRLPDATDTAASRGAGVSNQAPAAQTTLGLRVNSITADLRKQFNLRDGVNGVVVTEVDPNTAEQKFKPGTVIVELQRQRVTAPTQFRAGVEQLRSQGKSNALLLISNGDGQKSFTTLKLK
jgi:S1-C subfamily serine protease